MPREPSQLRADALRIWHAGLNAVRSERLMKEHVRLAGRVLSIDEGSGSFAAKGFEERAANCGCWRRQSRAGMSAVLEEILGADLIVEKQLVGWVNVPADCATPSRRPSPARGRGSSKLDASADRFICTLCGRSGVNEPTPEAAAGREETPAHRIIVGARGSFSLRSFPVAARHCCRRLSRG